MSARGCIEAAKRHLAPTLPPQRRSLEPLSASPGRQQHLGGLNTRRAAPAIDVYDGLGGGCRMDLAAALACPEAQPHLKDKETLKVITPPGGKLVSIVVK